MTALLKYILSFVCFFCACGAWAQSSEYEFVDTSIVTIEAPKTDTEIVEAPSDVPVEDSEEEDILYYDTTLVHNGLAYSADSAAAIRATDGLGYTKHLDSLLRAHQAALKKEEPRDEGPSWLQILFSSAVTKLLFWVLALSFVAFILYRLFLTKGIFQFATTRVRSVEQVVETSEDPRTTNYETLIQSAVAAGDFRLAIRYHYLQLLQSLHTRGVIQWAPDKTNSEYLRELVNAPYRKEFGTLTRHFEYAWYGGFTLERSQYDLISGQYQKFNNSLPR